MDLIAMRRAQQKADGTGRPVAYKGKTEAQARATFANDRIGAESAGWFVASEAWDGHALRVVYRHGKPIANQLRDLARLRDEGIITPGDFEAKKAELLARI